MTHRFLQADQDPSHHQEFFLKYVLDHAHSPQKKIVVESIPISRLSFHKIHRKYLKFFNIFRLASETQGMNFADALDKPAIYMEGEGEELVGTIFEGLKK